MRAGALRHRLIFQSPTTSANAQGGQVKGWSTTVTLWGSIEPSASHEEEANHQDEPITTAKITIRYYDGIKSNMRVVYGTKYYRITGPPINWNERNIYLVIPVEETKDFE